MLNWVVFEFQPVEPGGDAWGQQCTPRPPNRQSCYIGSDVSGAGSSKQIDMSFRPAAAGRYTVRAWITGFDQGKSSEPPPPEWSDPNPGNNVASIQVEVSDRDADGTADTRDFCADGEPWERSPETPQPGCSAPPPSEACSDGRDNDGDGRIDFPADTGCLAPGDTDETATPVARCDAYWVARGKTLSIAANRGLLANDADPSGSALAVVLEKISFGASKLKLDTGTGAFRFVASARKSKLATMRYRAKNAQGERSLPAMVYIVIGGTRPKTSLCDNRPPVAVADRWRVRPGLSLEETVLANDHDPDGDAITAKVQKISFAAREWSGLDSDGGFLYIAGPGTTRVLVKKITYVAVDAKGAESEPVIAEVTITRPTGTARLPSAATRRARTAATGAPLWQGPFVWAQLCFGGGSGSRCFTMLSPDRTVKLNRATGWTDLPGARTACLEYGFLPMKNADCAKALLAHGAGAIWDKSIVRAAADNGECLLFEVRRNRTWTGRRRGAWGKPVYETVNSRTTPYDVENPRYTGHGKWTKGFSGTWQVPLFCGANGLVYRKINQDLVEFDDD